MGRYLYRDKLSNKRKYRRKLTSVVMRSTHSLSASSRRSFSEDIQLSSIARREQIPEHFDQLEFLSDKSLEPLRTSGHAQEVEMLPIVGDELGACGNVHTSMVDKALMELRTKPCERLTSTKSVLSGNLSGKFEVEVEVWEMSRYAPGYGRSTAEQYAIYLRHLQGYTLFRRPQTCEWIIPSHILKISLHQTWFSISQS